MSTTSFLLRKARFFQKKLANCASVKETVTFAHFAVACSLINSFCFELKKTFHRKLFLSSTQRSALPG